MNGILIILTHTGLSKSSHLLSDAIDKTAGNNARGHTGSYVPVGGELILAFSNLVALSYAHGDLRGLIDGGHLTEAFIFGSKIQKGATGVVFLTEATYTGIASDRVYIKATAQAVNLQLASFEDHVGTIEVIDAFGNADIAPVTITPNGTDTINGVAAPTLLGIKGGTFSLIKKSGGWMIPVKGVVGASFFGIGTVTSATTLLDNDQVYTLLCDATLGAFPVNLPAANTNTGRLINLKKIDATANIITINGNGSTIDGNATKELKVLWSNASIQSNGTSWFIL